MSTEPPFNGPLGTIDPRCPGTIYIRVIRNDCNEIEIKLYNAPAPFSLNILVGNCGSAFRIRRVRRGWIYSTFIVTFLDDSTEIEYKTVNGFGDALAEYTDT